jgi:hypothetical protein
MSASLAVCVIPFMIKSPGIHVLEADPFSSCFKDQGIKIHATSVRNQRADSQVPISWMMILTICNNKGKKWHGRGVFSLEIPGMMLFCVTKRKVTLPWGK